MTPVFYNQATIRSKNISKGALSLIYAFSSLKL